MSFTTASKRRPSPGENAKTFLNRNVIKLLVVDDRIGRRLGQLKHRCDLLAEAWDVLFGLHKFKTLFYPACGEDWSPLSKLSSTCDLFIFSDWGTAPESVPGKLEVPGLKLQTMVDLDMETVRNLADGSLLPTSWKAQMADRHDGPAPWGKYASFQRKGRKTSTPVHAFFLGAEAATLFANLFLPLRVTPEVLCLINCTGPSNWTDFRQTEAPLGQLMTQSSLRPMYLVGQKGRTGNWPLGAHAKLFSNWTDRQWYQPLLAWKLAA